MTSEVKHTSCSQCQPRHIRASPYLGRESAENEFFFTFMTDTALSNQGIQMHIPWRETSITVASCFFVVDTQTHTHTNPDMAKRDEECFVVAFPVIFYLFIFIFLHIYDYIYHCCREVNNLPVAAMTMAAAKKLEAPFESSSSWRQMQYHLSDIEWGFLTR